MELDDTSLNKIQAEPSKEIHSILPKRASCSAAIHHTKKCAFSKHIKNQNIGDEFIISK